MAAGAGNWGQLQLGDFSVSGFGVEGTCGTWWHAGTGDSLSRAAAAHGKGHDTAGATTQLGL
jgi:hypothetical protein